MTIDDVLRTISQTLLVPAQVILVLLLVFVALCLGSLIVEAVVERRYFRFNASRDVNAISAAPYEKVEQAIEGTRLLRDQKNALILVTRNMGLPDEDLFALAKSELAALDDKRQWTVRQTELVTKIGPMMGLICTLVPLGPGIVAMGNGYVDQLSQSLLTAFDGTVAGLLAAVFAMVISMFRKRWYAQYNVCLESLMNAVLEKAERARREGVELPCGYYREPASGKNANRSQSREG